MRPCCPKWQEFLLFLWLNSFQCVCVCVCAIFFIRASYIDRHFGCSHFLAVVSNAVVNIGVYIPLGLVFSFSVDKYLEVEYVDHGSSIFNFWRNLHTVYPFIKFVCPPTATAAHSSALAWNIPWAEEPGGLQSMGLHRVGHDRATSLSLFTFLHWRRKWQLTPVFLPGESQGWGGAWWAAVYGVAQSRTRLKQLSSSSSSTQCQVQSS